MLYKLEKNNITCCNEYVLNVKKKLAFSLVATLPMPASADAPGVAPAPPGVYQLDKSHASLELRINNLGFSNFTIRFRCFDAELMFDPAHLAASKVSSSIDVASLQLEALPKMCLDIINGPQLFDTEKFPMIVFESTPVTMMGAKTMVIMGTLTLHGVSRPVTLNATFNVGYAGMASMEAQARIGFSAHGVLKRSEFGMGLAFLSPAASRHRGLDQGVDRGRIQRPAARRKGQLTQMRIGWWQNDGRKQTSSMP
jgi:polyisoprenoid-binding protein YceI